MTMGSGNEFGMIRKEVAYHVEFISASKLSMSEEWRFRNEFGMTRLEMSSAWQEEMVRFRNEFGIIGLFRDAETSSAWQKELSLEWQGWRWDAETSSAWQEELSSAWQKELGHQLFNWQYSL